ncbi:MAG: TonB family protein [Sphingomonadaceae bacterium]|nr:TonB family protein [Sphingomonadaceae bacterium]
MGRNLYPLIGGLFMAGASLVSTAASADDSSATVLAPSSQWNVSYDEDSCRLLRIFGTGDDRTVFYIERYEPGDRFFMVVAGKGINKRSTTPTTVRFGPSGRTIDDNQTYGDLGDFGPAILINEASLAELGDSDKSAEAEFNQEALAADTDIFGQVLGPDQEGAVSWLEVKSGTKKPFRLALGPMDKPMEAMRKCTDDLVASWGFDITALRGMSRAPVPVRSPGTWLTAKDYPRTALGKGQQGIVQVRLAVGADGSPQSCHIQRSTRPVEFDQAVCRGLMKRARFHPALGADGEPMPSFWRSGVRFVLPG